MQKIACLIFALLACFVCRANDNDSIDSVNNAMQFQTGQVPLSNGIAELTIPKGFKYLDTEQSKYVLTELWGNPPQPDVVGMLFPDNGGPFADSTYAFVISYKPMGHVKDAEANQVDYDDMLQRLQKEEVDENAKRTKMGYPSMHIVGWAEKPFYDKEHKVLHWAKELQFGGSAEHTLNYDIVILGRKGILTMNAVGSMGQLGLVKKDIGKVLNMAAFSAGNRHADFDPEVDEVAAWTIGSLVAGKVLAKVGIFAFLGKFLKFIVLGLAAAGAWVARFLKGRKAEEQLADAAI